MFYHSVVSQNTYMSSPELQVLVVEHNDWLAHMVLAHGPISSKICDWCDQWTETYAISISGAFGFKGYGFQIALIWNQSCQMGLKL
jgi:hypothetical protein